MTELIVVLDIPNNIDASHLAGQLFADADVTFFKIGISNLLDFDYSHLVNDVLGFGDVMLDIKLFDTPDTVHQVVERVWGLGVRFLTVREECVEGAMAVPKVRDDQAILAVRGLTSDRIMLELPRLGLADGVVCHPAFASYCNSQGGIVVCPRIRPAAWRDDGDHIGSLTPKVAMLSGADFVVVGRPIYLANDPVAAAQEIVRELEGAT